MAHFLTACACRGHKPKNLGSHSYHSRDDLLARMIRYRRSVRFLSAPSLFGKTSLALEYAESVFSFEDVFWLDGRSPCFLRDLDKGILSSTLLREGTQASLVIIDDLPFLDEKRQMILKQNIEDFVEHDWELIITAVPCCELTSLEEAMIHRISAADLLLTSGEVDRFRTTMEQIGDPADSFSQWERIPGVFWHEKTAPEILLNDISQEELPDDILLAVFVMLVLEEGSYEDIKMFSNDSDPVNFEAILASYVYLGLDRNREEFHCCSFPIDTIARAFSAFLEVLTAHSNFKGKNRLIVRLADALLGKGKPERACEVMLTMASSSQRLVWLDERSDHLLAEGCLLPAHKLFETLHVLKGAYRHRLSCAEMWRVFLLDQREHAFLMAIRLCQSREATDEIRMQSALLLSRSTTQAHQELAYEVLEKLCACSAPSLEQWNTTKMTSLLKEEDHLWKIPVIMVQVFRTDPLSAFSFSESCQRAFTPGDPELTLLFLFLLDCCAQERVKDDPLIEEDFTSDVMRLVSGQIEALIRQDHASFIEYHLILLWEKMRGAGPYYDGNVLPAAWKKRAQREELALFEQRKTFAHRLRLQASKKEAYVRSHPDELRKDSAFVAATTRRKAPLLSVDLFGGLKVQIGGEEVDPQLFSRQKVKALLAMLVINQGKELPRDRIAHILWPDSDTTSAYRNLHSVWSLLRKALLTPDATCPYLIRTQFSYKIDPGIMASDVSEFDGLCRKLLFGSPDVSRWTAVFTRLNELYRGDLLPTETANEAIIKARSDYRSRFVDSLAMAALRLFEEGEFRTALLFAQTAVSYDLTREDAYALLMRAQIALGQRTAALETYFKCRKYLSEELGIDPCMKTRTLYQEIITEGNDQVWEEEII